MLINRRRWLLALLGLPAVAVNVAPLGPRHWSCGTPMVRDGAGVLWLCPKCSGPHWPPKRSN